MKNLRCAILILAIVLIPTTASANVGTPLMWASMLHLVLGNAVIGLIEGLLLAWIFNSPKRKSIYTLIVANYVSAWAGGFLVAGSLTSIPDLTIGNIQSWFFAFVAIAFLITLLIELPFFWLALRSKRQKRVWVPAIKATLLIHSISYVLLFGWYWGASGTSMMTQLEVVSASELSVRDGYSLYYLSPNGDQVLRLDLSAGAKPGMVAAVSAPDRNDRLFVRAGKEAGFDLFVQLDSLPPKNKKEVLVRESFAENAAAEGRIIDGQAQAVRGTWFNMGDVPSLASDSDWEFRTGFWPVEGIRGENKKQNKKVRFSLETPFAAWAVRNATHVVGDLVVFQLGDDQICILDPESKKIALLVRGKGCIVVKNKAAPSEGE